ncbi:cobalamin biosynthesis protein CbiX [Clavibacter michiganensis]|nr:CbiX/SirB N-terminal domain-containing protein [Clavibacter michiganensis]PPF65475.1 cobalamin biosynthesis protein CbiX [Clavibacter michiganensis]
MTARPVLLAASHGTSDPSGRRAVASLVSAVAERRRDLTVVGSFVDVQQPDVPTALDTIGPGTPVVIVPLLLSTGYHVHVDLAEAAAEAVRSPTPREVVVTSALGPDARLSRILAERLASAGLRDDDTVVLAAAGSSDSGAVEDCRAMGSLLAAELKRPVTVGFLSAAEPRLEQAVTTVRAESPGRRVVVASYLLAPGYFQSLVHRAGADVVTDPLLIDGQSPPPELVDVVVDRFERQCDEHVSEAYQTGRTRATTW